MIDSLVGVRACFFDAGDKASFDCIVDDFDFCSYGETDCDDWPEHIDEAEPEKTEEKRAEDVFFKN